MENFSRYLTLLCEQLFKIFGFFFKKSFLAFFPFFTHENLDFNRVFCQNSNKNKIFRYFYRKKTLKTCELSENFVKINSFDRNYITVGKVFYANFMYFLWSKDIKIRFSMKKLFSVCKKRLFHYKKDFFSRISWFNTENSWIIVIYCVSVR